MIYSLISAKRIIVECLIIGLTQYITLSIGGLTNLAISYGNICVVYKLSLI